MDQLGVFLFRGFPWAPHFIPLIGSVEVWSGPGLQAESGVSSWLYLESQAAQSNRPLYGFLRKLEGSFLWVLILIAALLFGVYIGTPDLGRLPYTLKHTNVD